jgi:hypothetical protein
MGDPLNDLELMLCDACLYKVESSNGSVLIADMCKRCQKKMFDAIFETAEVVERQRDE